LSTSLDVLALPEVVLVLERGLVVARSEGVETSTLASVEVRAPVLVDGLGLVAVCADAPAAMPKLRTRALAYKRVVFIMMLRGCCLSSNPIEKPTPTALRCCRGLVCSTDDRDDAVRRKLR
jgi:hypothetical protein